MSEPMTNIEIEDVLSSIRRLVSEDFRTPAPEKIRSADKLVLTPALRVVADNSAPVAPALSLQDQITREAAAAVLESALSGSADDWEPDGSEVTATEWSVEWERERDRMVRLHLRPAASQADPVIEPEAVQDIAARFADEPFDAAPVFRREPVVDRAAVSEPEPELIAEIASDDEDGLRDMVREIIREELQGDLGERITRSVRKLVRAEINRALAAREIG